MHYNSYHTSIKQLARQYKLLEKYIRNIDRSTIWRWKNEQEDKYLGSEFSNIKNLNKFLERKESDTIIRKYLKLASVISKIVNQSKQFQKVISIQKEQFVKAIIKFQKGINVRLVLKLCNITSSVFYYWKNQVFNKCLTSPLQLCRRIYPNQLTEGEASKINEMLINSEFKYWPINSIAYYALRNNLVNASLATWYNYAKYLGITHRRFSKKSRYGKGIRASAPHQIWHADITVVKCLNGMKYYVYLLMDNFSRYILNWQVSDKVSAKIRMDSIRQAYDQYIKGTDLDVKLIADGGVENNNGEVDALLNSEGVSIKKLIAGKDIKFSNSLVEAQNKIFKYHYLFKQSFNDLDDLNRLMEWNVNDYQIKRPHHSLKGLIPIEALNGISVPKEQWIQQIEEARQVRLQENTSKSCVICTK